jgi:hypothetical protein
MRILRRVLALVSLPLPVAHDARNADRILAALAAAGRA